MSTPKTIVVLLGASLLIPVSPHAQTTVAGSVPGAFRVTESGAAEYRIPIRVPPGVAGMEPKLALAYNSQTGNGLLGVGWNLEGLSAITRCPRTFAQDDAREGIKYNSSDRFCLDGQRLIAPSASYGADGTQYRTERESFSKVISHGPLSNDGPVWFEVRTKSGQILEYGNTTDSRIEAQGRSAVRVWALNKVSDTKGNFLKVKYTEDATNGDYYPAQIDYTGNGAQAQSAYVQFFVETRPDVVPLYQVGSVMKSTQRLTHLKTFVGGTLTNGYLSGGTLVNDYKLSYKPGTNPSVLASITLCDTSSTCLSATALDWTVGTSGKLNVAYKQSNYPTDGQIWRSVNGTDGYSTYVADVNGDGKADLVQVSYNGSAYLAQVLLSNGDGTYTVAFRQTNYPTDGQIWGDGPFSNSTYIADVNGDGKADLVQISNSTYAAQVLLSNGDGTFSVAHRQSNYPTDGQIWRSVYNGTDGYSTYVADVNGDGKSDLVQISYNFPTYQAQVLLSNGDGTFTVAYRQSNFPTDGQIWGGGPSSNSSYVADVNGDGKADLVQINNVSYLAQVFLANGDGTYTLAYSQSNYPTDGQIWRGGSDGYATYIADVNGDGKSDLVQISNNPNYLAQVLLSKGDGTFTLAYRQSNYPTDGQIWGGGPPSNMSYIADVNGDGKSDLVQINSVSWLAQVYLANGDGTYTLAYRQSNYPTDGQIWRGGTDGYSTYVTDFDGDGRSDLLQIGNTVWLAQTLKPDNGTANLLASISPLPSATSTITLRPITDTAIYTRDSNGAYPIVDVQAPLYAVSAVALNNGIGGTQTTTYKYGGAKFDQRGRGLLGFRWMEGTDPNTLIKSRREFRQDWPYVGLTSLTSRTQNSGALLNQATNTYSCINPALGTACTVAVGNAYFPYVSQTVETANDLNGAVLPTVTTTIGNVDIYGNVGTITVSTSDGSTADGYSKTTTNTYAPADTTNWFLGRLTRSTVQSTTP